MPARVVRAAIIFKNGLKMAALIEAIPELEPFIRSVSSQGARQAAEAIGRQIGRLGVGSAAAAVRAASAGGRSRVKRQAKERKPQKATTGVFYRDARSGTGKNIVMKKKRKRKSKKTLASRVAHLEKTNVFATYERRKLDDAQLACSANQCAYGISTTVPWFGISNINNSVDSLIYYDRTAGTTGEVNLDITNANTAVSNALRVNVYSKVMIANNHSIPCDVDMYLLKAKIWTDDRPQDSITAGETMLGVSNASTNILTYPSDFKTFNDTYSILKHHKVHLTAGDHAEMIHNESTMWDHNKMEDLAAATGATYMKGSLWWFFRIQGIVSHDQTTTTNIGFSDATIDIIEKSKYYIRYPSDAKFHKIETGNSLGSLTVPVIQAPTVEEVKLDS